MNWTDLITVSRWFTPFPGPVGWPEWAALVGFILWTVASSIVFRFRRRFFVGNGALIGAGTRYGPYAIWLGILGLFLLGCRFATVPYVSIRFALYLSILAVVGYLGFLGYYFRKRYPADVAAVRAEETRRRYNAPRRKKKRAR